MEEQFVDKSRVSVREISKAVARDFIEKHHYTHKFSSTRYALGVFYREETEHMFFAGDTPPNNTTGRTRTSVTFLSLGNSWHEVSRAVAVPY